MIDEMPGQSRVRAKYPPSPQQMSLEMRRRYGLAASPWPRRVGVGVVLCLYAAVVCWVAVSLSDRPVTSRLLLWSQPAADRVDVTFEVRRPPGTEVECLVRAQDNERIDVGYARVILPAGTEYAQQTYRLRVLGPAMVAEVLDCQPVGEVLRAPGPQFPPGVAPPEQPWSDGSS